MQRAIAKAESEALGKRLRADTQTQMQRWLNKHKHQNKVNDLLRGAHALEERTACRQIASTLKNYQLWDS